MEGDCTDTVRVDLPTVPLRKLPVGPGHPCSDGVADLQGYQTCEECDFVPQGIIGLPCVIMASFFSLSFLKMLFLISNVLDATITVSPTTSNT